MALKQWIEKLWYGGSWSKAYWDQIVIEKIRTREQKERADKLYADWRSLLGEVCSLKRKLERCRARLTAYHTATEKRKEQHAIDEKYTQNLQERIRQLESSLAGMRADRDRLAGSEGFAKRFVSDDRCL